MSRVSSTSRCRAPLVATDMCREQPSQAWMVRSIQVLYQDQGNKSWSHKSINCENQWSQYVQDTSQNNKTNNNFKKQRLPHTCIYTCGSGMGRVSNVFACLQLPSLTRLSSPASEPIKFNGLNSIYWLCNQDLNVVNFLEARSCACLQECNQKGTSNSWNFMYQKKCLVRRHFCCQQSLSRIVALHYNSTVDSEGKGEREEGNGQTFRRRNRATSKSGVQVPPLHTHLFWDLPPQVGNDRAKAKHTCTHPSYNPNPYGFAVLHGFPLFVVGSCTNQVNVSTSTICP